MKLLINFTLWSLLYIGFLLSTFNIPITDLLANDLQSNNNSNSTTNNSASALDIKTLVTTNTDKILKIPIENIHPSQMSVGHASVIKMYEGSKNQTPQEFQNSLYKKDFPAIIAPNGEIYISDGHHRMIVATLRNFEEKAKNGYKIKVKITDNFLNKTWSDFVQQMIYKNKIYFDNKTIKEINKNITAFKKEISLTKKHSSNWKKAKEEEIWYGIFKNKIPSSFLDLPDNPLRSLIGDVLYELKITTTGPNFKNYSEFRLAEIIDDKLLFNIVKASGAEITIKNNDDQKSTANNSSINNYSKICYTPIKFWSCSDLNEYKEKIKQLIETDKEVKDFLRTNRE
ncbi:MAG: ParB/Srx family N-terminal domain-containing protein [Oligoflexia bacterium]|nr:ParB/Srx family N-terminal domain-containing protein [Oligoflexia bacterium]